MKMIKLFLISILLLFIVISNSEAAIIEVPIPEFVDSITIFDNYRIASFDLGTPLDTIYDAWIYLSGNITYGWGKCCQPWPWEEGHFETLPGKFSAGMNQRSFEAQVYPPNEGEFQLQVQFESANPNWEFLKDGIGEVELKFKIPYIIACPVILIFRQPTSRIYEAKLIINAENKVDTESASWGVIKRLFYR